MTFGRSKRVSRGLSRWKGIFLCEIQFSTVRAEMPRAPASSRLQIRRPVISVRSLLGGVFVCLVASKTLTLSFI